MLKMVYGYAIFKIIFCFSIVQRCETLLLIMKAIVLELSTQQRKSYNYHKMIVQRLVQSSTRSQSHKMVLLTLRRPGKIAGKQQIKDFLQHEKKTSSFFPYPYHSSKTQPNQHDSDHKASKIFKQNLKNLISKSTSYVAKQIKVSASNSRRIQTEFRNIKDSKGTSQESNHKQNCKSKRQKVRSVVYEESKANIQKRLGYKVRNKTTFYINNFMKTKHSKLRKVSLDCNLDKPPIKQQKLQKSGFFPWDRQLDSQEDVLAAS